MVPLYKATAAASSAFHVLAVSLHYSLFEIVPPVHHCPRITSLPSSMANTFSLALLLAVLCTLMALEVGGDDGTWAVPLPNDGGMYNQWASKNMQAAAARKVLILEEAAGSPGSGSVAPDEHHAAVIILASFVIALICILVVGFGTGWCACARGANAANRGVDKSLLLAIPTMPYVAPAAGEDGNAEVCAAAAAECPICLMEFEAGDSTRVLPQCGHGFHAGCIDKWLHGHSSWLSCRRILSLERPPGERCIQFDRYAT